MRQKILSIREENDSFDGYVVTTTRQTIEIGVSNFRDCCESWGYVTSDDKLQDYVGAYLTGIAVVDTALDTMIVPGFYEGNIMFVNLETSIGLLQLAVYNAHNGYYGHTAFVHSKTLNFDTSL